MSEFDEFGRPQEPQQTDFTANQPQEPQNDAPSYNYSYVRPTESRPNQNPYSQVRPGSYYQPPVSAPSGYGTAGDNTNPPDMQPPKKSSAGKVVAIIFVVCIVIAIAGMASSIMNKNGASTSPSKEKITASQSADEVKTKDSEKVATKDTDGNYTVAGVAEKTMDSCVGISVYSKQAAAYNYFYGYGYGNQSDSKSEPTLSGEGSGVIFSESNGKTYIITCAHVISEGDSFKVTLNNKKEYEAQRVAFDSQTDIGVLSIEATGLQVAEFANSDNIVVGEQVVAIGCPGGLDFMNSVASGYISALDRPISSSIGYNNKCIQTDAAINPGNSGGALFNMQGQVIGINSSKIASTEYEGMGFAVPSSTAVATANSLIKSGYVEGRAKIGIEYTPLTNFTNSKTILNALAEKGYKDAEGTMVVRVIDEKSDLSTKDVKEYDMIVAINDKVMTSTDVLTSTLADSKPGDTVKLTIARIDDNEIKIKEIDCKLIESKG
jgi:serine protease Do